MRFEAVRCGAVRYGAVRCGAVRCGAIPFAALALKELCRHREQLWLSSEVLGEGGGVLTAARLLLDRLVVDDGAAGALGWHVGVRACARGGEVLISGMLGKGDVRLSRVRKNELA